MPEQTAIPQISQEVGPKVIPETSALQGNPWEAWTRRIKAAEDKRQEIATKFQWEPNIKRYLGISGPVEIKVDDPTSLQVNKDFTYTEQKRHQLFFQSPDVQLSPELPGLEPATVVFQAVVNKTLG